MNKQQLIELWMANRFIPSRGPRDLHEMGCEIFNELTWRSFFQEMKKDIKGIVTCKMHDLIHDVATSIMGHECCAIELNEKLKIPKTARHLSLYISSSERMLVDIPKMQSLRSLILESRFYDPNFYIPSHFTKQKYLKTLNLKHCYELRMLPKGMKQLKNLRYLDITDCFALTSMPIGLGHLSCLRKLTMFIVGKDDGRGIDELKELALEGELSIRRLYNVKSST
ncbi:hypothetical protein REPUB_Repub13aG0134600 [Reevesia pubescens]